MAQESWDSKKGKIRYSRTKVGKESKIKRREKQNVI